MFCVQGQFPKDSLEEWGWGFWGNLPIGLGQKQLDEMPFFHMQTVAKRFVYALSWLDNPNTIKPASALGSGFCHCQSLWYSEEMLAQEGQQSLISKCIWNPLSFLLEPLQNHSGYKPFFFFFPFSGCISHRDKHNWLFLQRDVGICGPKVKHAGAWRGELHFIGESKWVQAELSSRLGARSNCWLFFLQGKASSIWCSVCDTNG